MTLQDFTVTLLKKGLFFNYSYLVTVFSILKKSNDYFTIANGSVYAIFDKQEYKLDWVREGEPILSINNTIVLDPGVMNCVTDKIVTTIGMMLHNLILIEYPFKGKIPFQNEPFVAKNIESKYIAPRLNNEDSDSIITDIEYEDFVDAASYLENCAYIFVYSSTAKTITPPPNNKKYREELIKEAVDKHGEDALQNYAIVSAINKKLEEADKDYLADDPTMGVLTSGKIMGNSRQKLYRMSGAEKGFKSPTDPAHNIEPSLSEGTPLDPETIASENNSIRFGSFSRGSETVKGGVTGNIVLRVGASIKVSDKDCGVGYGKLVPVTKDNAKGINERYVIENNNVMFIKDIAEAEKYIGKTVELRDPQYCKDPNGVCKICGGKGLELNPHAVSAILTDISSIVLNTSMKMMHASVVKTTRLDLATAIT